MFKTLLKTGKRTLLFLKKIISDWSRKDRSSIHCPGVAEHLFITCCQSVYWREEIFTLSIPYLLINFNGNNTYFFSWHCFVVRYKTKKLKGLKHLSLNLSGNCWIFNDRITYKLSFVRPNSVNISRLVNIYFDYINNCCRYDWTFLSALWDGG